MRRQVSNTAHTGPYLHVPSLQLRCDDVGGWRGIIPHRAHPHMETSLEIVKNKLPSYINALPHLLLWSKVCGSKISPASSSSDMPCAEGSRVFGSVVHSSNRERLYCAGRYAGVNGHGIQCHSQLMDFTHCIEGRLHRNQ
jgi:hypothetical protein